MYDDYLAVSKCHSGNGLWILRRENSNSTYKLWHKYSATTLSTGDFNYANKNSMKMDSQKHIYLGLPSANSKGKVMIIDATATSSSNSLVQELQPSSDLSDNSYFGQSVAVDGNYLYISAYGINYLSSNSGCIFVYEKDSNGDFKDIIDASIKDIV